MKIIKEVTWPLITLGQGRDKSIIGTGGELTTVNRVVESEFEGTEEHSGTVKVTADTKRFSLGDLFGNRS